MSQFVEQDRAGVRAVEVVQHWSQGERAAYSGQPVHALVTGASGFMGQHLARRLLADGKRVRLYVRRPEAVEELRQLGAEVVVGGLDDAAAISRAVEGVETVYHLAAMTSALRIADMLRANRDGTHRIAEACATQRQKPLLVYVSSVAASGPVKRGALRRETDVPAPISNYGRSKFAGEQAVAEFAGEMPITIVRPGIVFGPGNLEMLPMFRSIKYVRAHFIAGWRSPALSLVYVDDCIDLVLHAAASGSRLPANGSASSKLTSGQGVYFAAAPEYPDYAELGRMTRVLLKRPWAPVIPLVGPMAWLAAGLNERVAHLRGKPNSFNIDKIREATVESWACSSDLAARDLNFSPQLSISQRLKSTIEWYCAHRWL